MDHETKLLLSALSLWCVLSGLMTLFAFMEIRARMDVIGYVLRKLFDLAEKED